VKLVPGLLVEPEDSLGVDVGHSRLVSGSQRRGSDELDRWLGGLKGVVDREHHVLGEVDQLALPVGGHPALQRSPGTGRSTVCRQLAVPESFL
jgi:hypothetical protein